MKNFIDNEFVKLYIVSHVQINKNPQGKYITYRTHRMTGLGVCQKIALRDMFRRRKYEKEIFSYGCQRTFVSKLTGWLRRH
ncbi:MAG: hypothetical protein LLG02_08630 [Pelosinus sp.]|nr:hypothetical protein [Pelosinus sp.]